jgi:hypothetical protein
MRVPVFPQSPVLEKAWVLGRSRLSGMSLYLVRAVVHFSYSFSSMACEVCNSFSPYRPTILDFMKRGWLISMSKSFTCSLSLLPINK